MRFADTHQRFARPHTGWRAEKARVSVLQISDHSIRIIMH